MPKAKVLVAGWFSFSEVIATVGDLLGCQVLGRWLQECGRDYDVAMAPYMQEGVDWRQVDPHDYDLLIFTTGPLKEEALINELLARFSNCEKWAINVSLIHKSMRDKFDRLWVRDSKRVVRPDLALTSQTKLLPLLAVAYTPAQSEYPDGRHELVQTLIRNWIETRQLAAVEVDMNMFVDHTFPRLPAQVESVIARVDVVISMRLHATVLALKYGKPVIACDPVSGGAKVYRQAKRLAWPKLILPDDLSQTALDRALEFCLSQASDKPIKFSQDQAHQGLADLEVEVKEALA